MLQLGKSLWASGDYGSFYASLRTSAGVHLSGSWCIQMFSIFLGNPGKRESEGGSTAHSCSGGWGNTACESQARFSRAVLHMSI